MTDHPIEHNSGRPVVFLIIDTLQAGGTEKSLLEILPGLRLVSPVILVLFSGSNELELAYLQAGIKIIRLDLPVSNKFNAIAAKIVPLLQKMNPAIVHTSLFRSDMVGRKLKQYGNFTLVNSLVNDCYSLRRYKLEPWRIRFKLAVIHFMDFFSVHKVDFFIANSEAVRVRNAIALGLQLKKTTVLYRGRDSSAFDCIDVDALQFARDQLNLPSGKIFLTVSRMIPRKDHITLIKAFKRLTEEFSDVTLLLAGDGPSRGFLENAVKQAGLAKRVRFLGTRNDIPVLLKLSDYFVFPSLFEGLPGVLIESMLAKTPVIASDIAENLECMDESMAFYFKAGDSNALNQKMKEALHSEELEFRTARAYNRAKLSFDSKSVAQKYDEVYRDLMQGKLT